MFHFLKKLFKSTPSPYVVVKRKKNIKIKGMVYKIIFKDPPNEVDIKHGYYTFWDKVVEVEDYSFLDLDTGEKGAYWGNDDFNLIFNHTVEVDPSNFLQGKEFIKDDLSVIIPVKVIYLLEPTEEELTDDVEVEDILFIARSDIKEGDVVIS